jgi:hypothetical protein
VDNRLSNGCPGMGLIATFPVDIDAGAAISRSVNHDPLVAFAHGLTFLVFVVALGDISGGHFNPAVTIGLATAGVFPTIALRPTSSPKSPAASPPPGVALAFGGPVANQPWCHTGRHAADHLQRRVISLLVRGGRISLPNLIENALFCSLHHLVNRIGRLDAASAV